ncbi:MAG: hypothetical protein OXH84_01610 [Gammaproteobacteria bacterium]|nr:hypothetical protein [Gammaproteobacteria bacterium]
MVEAWVKPVESSIRIHLHEANRIFVGFLFDQRVNTEFAWDAAECITNVLAYGGIPFWDVIEKIAEARLIGFMRYGWAGYSFHRHPTKMANHLKGCAKIINTKYEGDPRNIWNSTNDVNEVRNRFEELPGIGPALSRMAVLVLVRDYGKFGGKNSLNKLDVKPDALLKRVFRRTGLVRDNARFDEYWQSARKLAQIFPRNLMLQLGILEENTANLKTLSAITVR